MGSGVSKILPIGAEDSKHNHEEISNVKSPNMLHIASKIGDVNSLLHSLLTDVDPWQLDEFDSMPVYYCSLYGHELCCALLLIKMGGAAALSCQDRDRCVINALNLEIKSLFTGDASTQSVIEKYMPKSIAEPRAPFVDPAPGETYFGDMFDSGDE